MAGWRSLPPLLLLVLLVHRQGVICVTITNLSVPSTVQNGTSGTVLDCEYTLLPDEAQPRAGLVVKWYFNGRPTPVYQWIPTQKPQDLDLLRGRLDMNYTANSHHAMEHRALRILSATPDLSGEWKCAVSTFKNEDFMTKKMVVFVPEKTFEVMRSKISPPEHVNVSCRASGVYPEPRMQMYRNPKPNGMNDPLPDLVVNVINRSGVFDILAWVVLPESDVNDPTVLECELRLPAANYTRRKRIIIYPGSMSFLSDDPSGSPSTQAVFWRGWMQCLLAAVLLKQLLN